MSDRNDSRLDESEPEQDNSLNGEAQATIVSLESTGTEDSTQTTDRATTPSGYGREAPSRESTRRYSPYPSSRVWGVSFALAGRYGTYQTNPRLAAGSSRADESATAEKLESPPDADSALGDNERASMRRYSPYSSTRASGVLFTLGGRYGAYQTNMGSARSIPRADELATAGKRDGSPGTGSELGGDERSDVEDQAEEADPGESTARDSAVTGDEDGSIVTG